MEGDGTREGGGEGGGEGLGRDCCYGVGQLDTVRRERQRVL